MTIASVVQLQKLKRSPLCEPDMKVFDAAVEIAELDVHALAVVDDGSLVGIITDQDIIRCLADSGSDFYRQTVSSWMTDQPITCAARSKLSTALNLMAKHDIRNLIVVQAKQPIAIVSSKEILAMVHEEDELELMVLRAKASEAHPDTVA